ncbi:MAG TPA: DUF5615 family PIN-like protein [Patescibacteria group bacterium]|nr:DUF5615 family PIN-like protein [Patescibacteria group bacterium]
MKFIVDENVHLDVYHFLYRKGFDVVSVSLKSPSITDKEVLRIALREQRIIITGDKDFGDLVYHSKIPHCGIILFRLESETPSIKINRLDGLLSKKTGIEGKFIVVTDRSN